MTCLANGVVLFGLSPDELWALTAAQYAAMSKVYFQQQELLDKQFAWVRALILEVNRDPEKRSKPFTPAEFLLFRNTESGAASDGQAGMSWEQQLAFVTNVLQPDLGGTISHEGTEEPKT